MPGFQVDLFVCLVLGGSVTSNQQKRTGFFNQPCFKIREPNYKLHVMKETFVTNFVSNKPKNSSINENVSCP